MKLAFYITITLFALTLCFGTDIAFAQQVTYTPLEPIPGYDNAANINFAGMLNLLFRVLFAAGALFAVVMLVFGGIMYMVSGAGVEMGEAKRRIQAAIFGLLLLAGAYLILYTINPQLLVFNISGIDNVPAPTQQDINITASATPTRIWCSNTMPAHDELLEFGYICKDSGKKMVAKERDQSSETPTSGSCTKYICE